MASLINWFMNTETENARNEESDEDKRRDLKQDQKKQHKEEEWHRVHHDGRYEPNYQDPKRHHYPPYTVPSQTLIPVVVITSGVFILFSLL